MNEVEKKIAELKKLVFAKKLSCTEFDFQARLLRGTVKDRAEYNAKLAAEIKREQDFHQNCAKYL